MDQSDQAGSIEEKERCLQVAFQNLWDGIEKSRWIHVEQIDKLVQNFKETMVQRTYQKDYGNDNPSLFYVDYNDFGKDNHLDVIQLEGLIRYLVLKGEVVAYQRARVGFCLYLDQDSYDQRNKISERYTKEQLEKAHAHAESFIFPSLEKYDEKERPIVAKVIKEIKSTYYYRTLNGATQSRSCDLHIDFYPHHRFLSPLLDELVNQKVIDSWNVSQRIVAVKLYPSDITEHTNVYRWKNWRDANTIKQEVQFRQQNHVTISDSVLLASSLTQDEQSQLKKIIEELNQRTQPGAFDLRGTRQSDKILNFLEAQNVIYHYQRPIGGNLFTIFVKATDQDQ